MKKSKTSLRTGLLTIIVICWLVPIVIVVALAGILFNTSYRRSVQQEIDSSAGYALRQVQAQLDEAISDSKSVSYDGIVRNAYRSFQQNGNIAILYRSVKDYLSQNYSRSERYQAVFISFWGEHSEASAYQINSGITSYGLMKHCQEDTPEILEIMEDADTSTRFLLLDGKLYMARNLLDSHFEPYASVVMLLEPAVVFQPLDTMTRTRIGQMQLCIDGTFFCIDSQHTLSTPDAGFSEAADVCYQVEIDEHTLSLTADLMEYDLWEENPWLGWTVVVVMLMVLPLLIIVIVLFHRHISRPIDTLAEANRLVQSGVRGYEITRDSPNVEFEKLYNHFNAMSSELKNQFERSYLEQQATQRAQIKALQSQINPHFLNNTLEIINWEARLAGNDRVSAMIEALSTMLDAALDRDGRTQILLKEEMGYVDAYLYIIQERLGEDFHVHKQIDPDILDQTVPRLILQPIVENAVEHDITSRHGGTLWVRVFRRENRMILEVEHEGTMTEQDRENIRILLSDTSVQGSRVGLRNVNQRLKLIYGQQGILTVDETTAGTILARIIFPTEGI